MAFVRFTANPKRETNDCIVRSIANATNRPWQDVMRELCNYAIEMYEMPNNSRVIEEYMYNRGIYVYPCNKSMTLVEFARHNPVGRYVVCLEDHAVSVIDGDWYDLHDSAHSEVVEYYKVEEDI